jgi:NifU-like protein involved in Fe-S cluster formation
MKYSAKLLDYFYHRQHAGSLNCVTPNIYQAGAGNADKKEWLEIWVEYRQCVVQTRFKATGSVALIAGGEFICRWLETKTWQDLNDLTPETILDGMELSALHIHIAHLILTVIKNLGFYLDGVITG